MSSTFDKRNEEQTYTDVFCNVAALYATLKQGEPYVIHRAELRQNVVTAEPVDFLADFELKARRTLNPTQYRLVLKYTNEERYQSIPKEIQQALGKVFLEADMDVSGAYRVLFYKAKNGRLQDRDEPVHFPEEVTNE
jgi:hypothetical protein